MIKLDPEDEGEEDDQPLLKTPQKIQMPPANTSQAAANDVTMDHVHTNNVQINLTRVNFPTSVEPPQNFVSSLISILELWFMISFLQEKAINVNSIPKSSQKPAKTKSPSKKSSSTASAKKKKRRKLSSSEEDESDFEDDDDY